MEGQKIIRRLIKINSLKGEFLPESFLGMTFEIIKENKTAYFFKSVTNNIDMEFVVGKENVDYYEDKGLH